MKSFWLSVERYLKEWCAGSLSSAKQKPITSRDVFNVEDPVNAYGSNDLGQTESQTGEVDTQVDQGSATQAVDTIVAHAPNPLPITTTTGLSDTDQSSASSSVKNTTARGRPPVTRGQKRKNDQATTDDIMSTETEKENDEKHGKGKRRRMLPKRLVPDTT